MTERTEAEAIADLAVKAAKFAFDPAFFLKSEDGREFLAVKDGHTATEVTLPHALPLYEPHHITQSVTLQTVDSLVDYVNRYKGAHTLLFADIHRDLVVAQVDYHAPATPGRVSHQATLQLVKSIEWTAWTGISGRLMEQLEFARFIEENAADVRAPVAADLLECVRDLQAHRKVSFHKAVRTASDNENFEFSEETEAKTRKGGIDIPTKFALGIPVYFGECDEALHAFLRWKLDDGSLKLGIQLHRAEHVRQAVFQALVRNVAERTGCAAVFGKL
jgi:uncharacterized protein YfdQ (DUF2303 family)